MNDKLKAAREAVAAINIRDRTRVTRRYLVAADLCIALVRAMDGEPVAWQYRFLLKDTNYWSGWTQVPTEEGLARLLASYKDSGFTAEGRALFDHPSPAPVGEAVVASNVRFGNIDGEGAWQVKATHPSPALPDAVRDSLERAEIKLKLAPPNAYVTEALHFIRSALKERTP